MIEPSGGPQQIAASSHDQDALRRINTWLDILEEKTNKLLEAFKPDELEPEKAAAIAAKFITIIARLLELRQQFTTENTGIEERLLSLIFGKQVDSDQK